MTWKTALLGALLVIRVGLTVGLAEETKTARARIVVIGDSITAGYGLGREEAYPALLQEKIDAAGLNFEIVNAGVSGDTTAGGLRRIDWVLGEQGAEIVLIALGGNDGLRGVSPDQTEKNLRAMVDRARALNPSTKILLAGMQMPAQMGPDYVAKFKATFPKVAEDTHVALIPFLLEGVGGLERYNQADRIHPTAEGQRRIAEVVWPYLKMVLDAPMDSRNTP